MKGKGNQPTFQQHLELHAALLSQARGRTILPRQQVNSYLMQATGVGTRQSVNNHLQAWEDLCLIAPGWNDKARGEKTVQLLPRPPGLGDESFTRVLEELVGQSPRSA